MLGIIFFMLLTIEKLFLGFELEINKAIMVLRFYISFPVLTARLAFAD